MGTGHAAGVRASPAPFLVNACCTLLENPNGSDKVSTSDESRMNEPEAQRRQSLCSVRLAHLWGKISLQSTESLLFVFNEHSIAI